MFSTRVYALLVIATVVLAAAGCAAGAAFRHGEDAMRAGNLDQAVAFYRTAVQADPQNATYKIALQRAMLASSRDHMVHAREYEQMDQLEAALGEYKLAAENDPSNRLAASKVVALERTIRERAEAARPKPAIQVARERARAAAQPPPLYNFNTRLARISFNNAPLREILNTIATLTGISVSYDRQYQDRNYSITLDGTTLEEALNQIMSVNGLAYKVLSERSILVFEDTPAKHGQYDDQVIQTFYLSNADAVELAQILSQAFRPPGIAVQPAIAPNKNQNSITIRATAPVVAIFEKLIQQNDKPRAEIVVDIEIMEVDRSRTKQYGLNLS
jgi:type II secretory pathway component HofQ